MIRVFAWRKLNKIFSCLSFLSSGNSTGKNYAAPAFLTQNGNFTSTEDHFISLYTSICESPINIQFEMQPNKLERERKGDEQRAESSPGIEYNK